MAKLKLQVGDGPMHTLDIPWSESPRAAYEQANNWEALDEVGEPAARSFRALLEEFFEDDGDTGGDDG